jgi:hypothetical protein
VNWLDVQVGDFNGDGKADLAGRVFQSGEWWVSLSTGSSFNASLWTTWSPAVNWVDVRVADLYGTGQADLVGRAQQDGQWWAAVSGGTAFTNQLWAAWAP